MENLNLIRRTFGFALAFVLLAGPHVLMAGPNDGLGAGEGPESGYSGPITPGAGWSDTANVPPAFYWGAGEPVFASDGPFTFDGNFCVFVTDDFAQGDVFRVYDNDVAVGTTSQVEVDITSGAVGPDAAFADPEWSSGLFPVGAGSHSITIEIIANPFNSGQGYIKVEECPLGTGESRATFPVTKDFNDNNPAEVEVTISCNTGLPLQQSDMISEGDGVTFVVTDFADGELDCEISESPVPAGYAADYFENGQFAGEESCTFENVRFGDEQSCRIDNDLLQVDVDVTKEWIDENPQFNAPNIAEANYDCSGERFGNASGTLDFFGTPDSDTESFSVYPHWDGGTTCTVTESVVEGGVEADDSDCQGLSVTPGSGASCTIVNTRLYEGIPTLSQYGLGLLALLMLGMGFVAFRRVV